MRAILSGTSLTLNFQQDPTITPPQHHAHENLEPSYEVLWIISSRIRYLIRHQNYMPPANMEFSPSASSVGNPISATSLMSSIMFASPSSSTLSPWSTLAREDTLVGHLALILLIAITYI